MTTYYRDGIETQNVVSRRVYTTREGHAIEEFTTSDREKVYFATLAGTHYCAHGATEAGAISDALWKDPEQRPSLEALKDEIVEAGPDRLITLHEFRLLTGACEAGCWIALKRAGLSGEPMKAVDVRNNVSREWGDILLDTLGWNNRGETEHER